MADLSLEQRVALLEQTVAQMQADQTNGKAEKPWLRNMGMFSGDEVMKEIFDEALKIREKDREKARRRYAKKPASRRAKK
ncbi:MAG: hypothetical protein HY289_08715 [Planctomycetes bacterium]|nr:hypothetical protein [Planctomycetota bacterium]